MNILIVDDEIYILESINNILKPTNFNCRSTTNPIEGFELIRNNHFDVVITDIRMPEMDGLEFLKKINEYNNNIKTIIITAYGDIETIISGIKAHIYSFFRKPLNVREFFDTLREIESELKIQRNLFIENKNLMEENLNLKTIIEKFLPEANDELQK